MNRLVSFGYTRPSLRGGVAATELMKTALDSTMMCLKDKDDLTLDGLVASPSLSEDRFMIGHHLATIANLTAKPHSRMLIKTIDMGGASPVSGILEADRMIKHQGCDLVAVVSGDAISSMPPELFFERSSFGPTGTGGPFIPLAYDRIAKWCIRHGRVSREQLAMVAVLMNRQAMQHPDSLSVSTWKPPLNLCDVLAAKMVGDVTSVRECAWRCDGAAAVLLASPRARSRLGHALFDSSPVLLGGGEASGSLYPPERDEDISDAMFSCAEAVQIACAEARITLEEIDYYGLYDCFPICFVKAVEAVGLTHRGGYGRGGDWVQRKYEEGERELAVHNRWLSPYQFPVNTHGGLLSFGAPWEAPAMYSVIEAVCQLRWGAGHRQVTGARKALVYGNGGIFSASSVLILEKGETGVGIL